MEKRDDTVQRDEISEGEEGEEVLAQKRDDAIQLQGDIEEEQPLHRKVDWAVQRQDVPEEDPV